MFGSDLSSCGGSAGSGGATRGVDALVARSQALIDTPRPDGGHSLAWHVEAMLVGDVPAIAVAAARASRSGSGPPVVEVSSWEKDYLARSGVPQD